MKTIAYPNSKPLGPKISALLCLMAMVPRMTAEENFAATQQSDLSRIVSLGGAATEIVFALGRGDHVVGRDQSSIYPATVHALPEVGYIRDISAEGVLSLLPTVIITTSDLGPPPAAAQLKQGGVPMVVVEAPKSAQELFQAIRRIAQALEAEETGEPLIQSIQDQLAQVKAIEPPPTVALFINPPGQPSLMAAGRGTKAEAIITLAGGRNALDTFTGLKPLNPEALVAINPEIILLATLETDSQNPVWIEKVYAMPAWDQIPAVQNRQVYTVPLSKTLSFGPRLGEVVLELAAYFTAPPIQK